VAVGRLPESGADLCSEPTISRLENLPGAIALKRMMAAMVELFCDSFDQVPRRILLDIDDFVASIFFRFNGFGSELAVIRPLSIIATRPFVSIH
jgi:Transposase DDE domain group 1